MDLTEFRALSFDCYGTLIDWESGITGVLRPWADEAGLGIDDERLLRAYADSEAAAEREMPGAHYPTILAEVFRRTGRLLSARRSTRRGRPGSGTRFRIGLRLPTRRRRWRRSPSATS